MAHRIVQKANDLLQWLFKRPRTSARLRAIVLWWEARRVPYNLLVGAVGLLASTVMVATAYTCESHGGEPIGLPDPPFLAFFFALAYAIAANVCYTGGWITELLLATIWRVDTPRFGPIALTLGTVLSVLVTLVPTALTVGAAVATSCGRP